MPSCCYGFGPRCAHCPLKATDNPAPRYSVGEIDRMRAAIDSIRIYSGPAPCGAADQTIYVEQRLRTYMLNGTRPEELEKQVEQKRALKARERPHGTSRPA